MKIANTYKQGCITWFKYKAVYSFITSLHVSIRHEEVLSGRQGEVLSRWESTKIITKRTKDTI